ncbi:hypothetical protein [Niallia sp. 03190]|uniref:hypothetical protein n=1 Tax=Niallia sp. 03190 TaxID=3458061 RepID=UPI004043C813
MKKELLFAFTAFFFLSLSAITGAYALEKEETATTISTNKVDFFHDGKEETIHLMGISTEEEKDLYKEVILEVQDTNGVKKHVQLEGGYNPSLQTVNMDQGKHPAIFIKIFTDKKGNKPNYYLYTFSSNEITEIAIPELPSITSQFKADYKAELTIEGMKTYSFNLFKRKGHYDQLGVYRKGQLNEPSELIVQPYSSFLAIRYHQKPAFKGIQVISGIDETDTIAYMETIWTRNKKDWKLEKIKVTEVSKKSH